MFKKLWSMIQQLEQAQGSKAKSVLLKKFVDDKDFVWMAKNALDQGHSFGVDELPEFQQAGGSDDEEIVELVSGMKKSNGVTDAMLAYLYQLMCSSEERYNVVSRILRKDLRCGVAAKTINKVAPGAIFRVGYQRCAGADFVNRIKYPAILQRKANGMFAYLLPDGRFMTRKGETSFIPGNIIQPYVSKLHNFNDKVLACELVVLEEDGKVMGRAKGNGLINAFFKGSGDPEVAKRIRAYTWLSLTKEEFYKGSSARPYWEIWEELSEALTDKSAPIQPIESWGVGSLEEAMTITRKLIRDGEEGTVLKSMSDEFFWADEDPSYFQVKLKAKAQGEFVIVDAYEGDPKKKYAGMLGGLVCRSKDGVIVSDCGIGFSDTQRKLGVPHWRAKAGNIMTGEFYGITEPDGSGVRALDHFVFVEERFDKTEADSYEYLRDTLLGVVE